MKIKCKKCGEIINIPDKKVPQGKSFAVKCVKCNQKNTVTPGSQKKTVAQKTAAPQAEAPSDTDSFDAEENPFDFLEEGAETALLCEPDDNHKTIIKKALENLEYHTSAPASPREVLKQMRFHDYDVIVINERFGTTDPDTNHILKYIEQLPMFTRRNMFVAMLTTRFRTTDTMTAFNKSVNLVINLKNINDIEKIMKRGLADNIAFYRVYKETLKKEGKT